jgi:RNA ligase
VTVLADLFDRDELDLMLSARYVRRQTHPTLPLAILNYTEQAVYDRAWNATTRQCRGLIYKVGTEEVVARPFPKFFNYGEPDAPALDLNAPTVVTDKLDGSLGILYPTPDGYAVATRGSFTSDQAIHASRLYAERYSGFQPWPSFTYLFEIVAPWNRVVVDYGETDDLFLLAAIETATGYPSWRPVWPGPRVQEFSYATLAHALEAEPRPGAEGLVVYFPDYPAGERVKLKQDDYVALHRILTGTNARHVYEFAAVRACHEAIIRTCENGADEAKHWASYLGLDPARVAQLLAVGDGWLTAEGIPDEFYGWVRQVIDEVEEKAGQAALDGLLLADEAAKIADRRSRYEFVEARAGAYVREVMRVASMATGGGVEAMDALLLKAWREASPEPTAPFARPEAVA